MNIFMKKGMKSIWEKCQLRRWRIRPAVDFYSEASENTRQVIPQEHEQEQEEHPWNATWNFETRYPNQPPPKLLTKPN